MMPICAVNTLDDEKPPPFTYVTRIIIYPDSCNLSLAEGCDCKVALGGQKMFVRRQKRFYMMVKRSYMINILNFDGKKQTLL